MFILSLVSPEDSVRVEPSLQIINHGSETNFTCFAQGGPDNIYLWFLNASGAVCTDCFSSPQEVDQFLMSKLLDVPKFLNILSHTQVNQTI